ncbi:flagellar motor switch protein FliN [Lutibaculum baratangense]|uniref:Flagellar motor switch protein FliN n=1 Tax=Lutibaculum baratangense AMV1 TaxID=631454 RepID=V4RBA5_9HYPH|nr:flagellar motor switch protein FliN [Lutibaculum baratangense]ESR22689.1 Flagellar motor switch protein FliN [Lutibaculum baratangense AMV1]
MAENDEQPFGDLSDTATMEEPRPTLGEDDDQPRSAADLEAIFDVPVRVSAILGRARMGVSELLGLEAGRLIELDRKVGEAVDIYVNDRLVARGEVVLVEDKLGITMTEIVKNERG